MSVKSSEDTGKLGYQKCKRKSSLSHCLSATNKVHEICAFEISCASVWFVLCMSHTTGACWYESTNFNLNVFFIFVCQSHNRFICEWAVNVIRKMCVLATNHLPSENNRKRKWRVEQVMVVMHADDPEIIILVSLRWTTSKSLSFFGAFYDFNSGACVFVCLFLWLLFSVSISLWFRSYLVCLCVNRGIWLFFSPSVCHFRPRFYDVDVWQDETKTFFFLSLLKNKSQTTWQNELFMNKSKMKIH